MSFCALVFVWLVAAIHVLAAFVEMFAWKIRGPSIFPAWPDEMFEQTRPLAFNQGLYNLFLVVGLVWSVFIAEPVWQRQVATVFLSFVAIAGIVGAASVSAKTLLVQTVPALIGLALVIWG